MSKQRKNYSREFKIQIIREVEAGKSVAQVSREHSIHPTQIHQWKNTFKKYGDNAFQGNGKTYTEQARVAELERMVGQLTMENSFLKKVLTNLEVSPKKTAVRGGNI